jgi:hypothetical protein
MRVARKPRGRKNEREKRRSLSRRKDTTLTTLTTLCTTMSKAFQSMLTAR